MTAHWHDTATSAVLVAGGLGRASVWQSDSVMPGMWICTDIASGNDSYHCTKLAAQQAAERALGVNCSEIPKCSATESGEVRGPVPVYMPTESCQGTAVPGAASILRPWVSNGEMRAPAIPPILLDAARLLTGDRQDQYGDAVAAHEKIAEILDALNRGRRGVTEAEWEAVTMIVRKLVRRMAGAEPRETYRDLIGYAVIASDCAREDYSLPTSPLSDTLPT